jgi:hypothetical protein
MFQIPDSTPAGQITYTFRQEPNLEVADTFLVGGEPVPTPEAAPTPEKRPQQADDPGESGKIAAVLWLGQRAVGSGMSDPAETRYGGAVDVKACSRLVRLSKLLGHSSISITADIYAHMLRGVGQRAVDGAAALIPRRDAHAVHTQSGVNA